MTKMKLSDYRYLTNKIGTSFTSIGVKAVLIYISVFILSTLFWLPTAKNNITTLAESSLTRLETEFDNVRQELNFYLINDDYFDKSCDQILNDLRRSVFKSDVLKEIGVYNKNKKIYCTNNNIAVTFSLYKSIVQRLAASEGGYTLSYSKAKASKEYTIALMFERESGEGLSVLLPPRYIVSAMRDQLNNEHLYFNIHINKGTLIKDADTIKKLEDEKSLIQLKSKRYPIEIKVAPSLQYYLYYLASKSWFSLIISSLCTIYFLYLTQKKLTTNSLENSLKIAFEKGYLEVYYQPIVDQRTSLTVGCESLLRWNDPVQGFISPEIFIPLAEKVGFIEDLTIFVITQAHALVNANKPLFSDRYISVNISRSVILKPSFMNNILAIFNQSPEFASKLVFEITEDNDFTNEELLVMKSHLDTLTEQGVRIAIDDFGTGYSGLDFIRQFPFGFVKIDRVFIKNLYDDSTIIPLLQSMLNLSNKLGMKVIVEGVEDSNQLELLSNLGFEYIQGFYYSKAVKSSQLIEYINQRPEVLATKLVSS